MVALRAVLRPAVMNGQFEKRRRGQKGERKMKESWKRKSMIPGSPASKPRGLLLAVYRCKPAPLIRTTTVLEPSGVSGANRTVCYDTGVERKGPFFFGMTPRFIFFLVAVATHHTLSCALPSFFVILNVMGFFFFFYLWLPCWPAIPFLGLSGRDDGRIVHVVCWRHQNCTM